MVFVGLLYLVFEDAILSGFSRQKSDKGKTNSNLFISRTVIGIQVCQVIENAAVSHC